MKKLSTGFLLLTFCFSGFAQEMSCLDKLLPYSRFSGLHSVTKDEWYDGKDALDPESAKNVVTFLVNSKLLCRAGEFVIKLEPTCAYLLPDIPQSNSCFVYTNFGHFLVNRDNGRNVNLIFTKDKRFSGPAD